MYPALQNFLAHLDLLQKCIFCIVYKREANFSKACKLSTSTKTSQLTQEFGLIFLLNGPIFFACCPTIPKNICTM